MAGSSSEEWSNASKCYSDFASRITVHMSEKALEHHAPLLTSSSQGELHFLDVAAGPGFFTKMLAAKLHAADKKYTISCTDYAEGMLDIGKQSISDPNVKFFVMDGQDMSAIPDKSMDGVNCMFGIMFMPEYQKSVNEMKRVLKPGAKATLGTWLKAGFIHMGDAYGVFLGALEPGEVSGGAKFMQVGNTLDVLGGYLKAAGFSDVKATNETIKLMGTADDLKAVYKMMSDNPILSMSVRTGKAGAQEPSWESFQEFLQAPLGAPYKRTDGEAGCIVENISNIAVGVA